MLALMPSRYTGPPMDLANMRSLGVRFSPRPRADVTRAALCEWHDLSRRYLYFSSKISPI